MHTSTAVTGDHSVASRFPRRPRWDGKQPDFSPQRVRALAQLRAWEAAEKRGAAPDPLDCMGGTELRALASSRAEDGRPKAYPFPVARPAGGELGDLVLSDRDINIIAWLFAVELAFGRAALLIAHPDMAALLGCCAKTAGAAMRRLAELGLVIAQPMFIPGGCGHAQLAGAYRASGVAFRLFGIRRPADRDADAGKDYQPSEIPLSGDKMEGVRSADKSIVETSPNEDVSHESKRVKARPVSPRGSNEPAFANGLRGAPQVAAMLSKGLDEHKRRIERQLVERYRAAVRELPYVRGAAPARTPLPPLDLGDMHPDDKSWIDEYKARRATGLVEGAGGRRAPRDEDAELAAVIAAANRSFDERHGA